MTQRTHSRTAEQSSGTSTAGSTDETTDGSDRHAAALADRRGVLKVAGVVVGAGALAACSSPPVPSATGQSSGSSAAGSGATSGASSAASSTASGGGTPTAEIPVGGGKVFADSKTVVTQPTAGTFKAFDATCTHQGCSVASVQDNQIICPCHQSHFDATTGDRVAGPATRALAPKEITVTGDTFTVA